MKKTLMLITIVLLLLQGCATHANFVKKYDDWVGQNIAHLIVKIGYPDSTFFLPNKNKVYVYERSSVHSLPSPIIRYRHGGYYRGLSIFSYGNNIVQESCKLFIETNKEGDIVKWSSRGNHCVANA